MSALVRSEVLKLRTVRTLVWLTLGLVALVIIPAVSIAAASGEATTAADDRSIARVAAVAIIFALVLGIIVIGSEGTHGTITQTFLVSPVRRRVLAAKALVAALVGLAFAVVAEALVLALAVPGASLDLHNARLVLLGVVVASVAAGVLGVGVGSLFTRQGPGIVVSLLWLLIGESVMAIALNERVKYLPGHVFAAAVSGERVSGDSSLLGMWAGVAGTALYTAAFVAAGALTLTRRDV